ncbi:hypothetical protein D3C71_1778420 [compost metagenome]
MIPPADTAISTPDKPNGAKPWTSKLAGLKKVNNTPMTSSGTMNLNTLTRLLALAKVFTLR